LITKETLIKIRDWVRAGGVLISSQNLQFLASQADSQILRELFPQKEGIKKIIQGHTLLYSGPSKKYLEFVRKAVANQKKIYPAPLEYPAACCGWVKHLLRAAVGFNTPLRARCGIYPWPGISVIDEKWKGVYITRFSDKVIYYNSNNFEVRKKVGSKLIEIKANSILVEAHRQNFL
jgi:hypothetical protein